jgi:multiple sugar transport system permease protein
MSGSRRKPGAAGGVRGRIPRLPARPVPPALAFFTGSQRFEVPLGTITAATVLVTVPLVVLVLIFQRRIVTGLTAGAVKG